LLRKLRSTCEVYNGLDSEIVNLFRVVRDDGARLRRLLDCTPFAREEFVESLSPGGGALERARKTVVRSFLGFGGPTRPPCPSSFRSRAASRVSYAESWSHYPAALDAIIERLRGVVIEHRDALDVMDQHDTPTTLHYVDPPYVASTRDNGSDYRHEMTDDDHCRLAARFKKLKGSVVLSGYASPLYDRLFSGWRRVERPVVASGGRRTEVLWLRIR
jgi:DNA adenine methylase